MRVAVTGDVEFKTFSIACDRAAGPDFERGMDRGLLLAAEDIGRAVHVTTDLYMPSDYEDIFGQRLSTQVTPERARRGVELVAWGRGRTGRTRDLPKIDKGQLKHPNFGRVRILRAGGKYVTRPRNMRRGRYYNPWSVTTIRAGFWSDPIENSGPGALERRLGDSLQGSLDQATR